MLYALLDGDPQETVRIANEVLPYEGQLCLYASAEVAYMHGRALHELRDDANARRRLLTLAHLPVFFDEAGLPGGWSWGAHVALLWGLGLTFEDEHPARFVTLLAVAHAAQERAGIAGDEDRYWLAGTYADCRARIAARIGAAACDDAWAAGGTLSVREAVELARAPLHRGAHDAFGLSPRGHEVLLLVAQGCSNAEIARRLFISPNTVSVHVSRVHAKLGVSSRTQAAAKAHAEGLVGERSPAA
jgi:DNA-binding CsgD family transcriptional regulator